jgi:ABC-type phosphate transport system permease subunit
MPVAMVMAMPVVWITTPAILTAIPRLRKEASLAAHEPFGASAASAASAASTAAAPLVDAGSTL